MRTFLALAVVGLVGCSSTETISRQGLAGDEAPASVAAVDSGTGADAAATETDAGKGDGPKPDAGGSRPGASKHIGHTTQNQWCATLDICGRLSEEEAVSCYGEQADALECTKEESDACLLQVNHVRGQAEDGDTSRCFTLGNMKIVPSACQPCIAPTP